MNVTDLTTYIRQQYNAVGDAFFSDAEIYRYIWAAQMELAYKAHAIERTYTTTSTSGTRTYSYPTSTIAIKRVTYDGRKLEFATLREDDTLTLGDEATTSTGEPVCYSLWEETIYLRPVPDTSSLDIVIYSYNEPQEVSATSTLEVPTMWHLALADFALYKMAGKDKNMESAQFYKSAWDANVMEAIKWAKKRLRGDSFHSVKDEQFSMSPPFIGGY